MDITSENKPICPPKVVVYYILCNDIEIYEKAVLTKYMKELVAYTNSKFSNSKIMVLLGRSKRDPKFNLKVNTMNMALQNLFCSELSVEICDNSNLLNRGYPRLKYVTTATFLIEAILREVSCMKGNIFQTFKKRNSRTSQRFEGWTQSHKMTIRK